MKKLLLAAVALMTLSARAENWGQWRGPNFNGSSSETNLPDSFSIDDADKKTKRQGIAWSCEMPGASNATPVVFGDHVFVASNNKTGSQMIGLCIDRNTGKILWQKVVVETTPGKVSGTGKNTLASCSPVTDGNLVCFTFGTGDIAVYDMTGKEVWTLSLPKTHGELTFLHGYSSTPLLYKDKLYVQMLRRDRQEAKGGKAADPKYDSYLLCLDWKTGKEIFKAPRKSDAKDGECESYSSPVLYERAGRPEILISGSLWVSGHDPETGKEYWHWGTLTPWLTGNVRSVSLPVANNDFIFAAGPRKRPVFAIKAGGTGALPTKDAEAWEFKEHDCAVPSPLLYDNYLYVLDDDKKKMTCIEPATGHAKWAGVLSVPEDLAGFSSSPVAGDGKIYCMNERGNALILSSQEFKVLCRVNFDEGFTASSPVIAQGHVFFRTAKTLYCVGK